MHQKRLLRCVLCLLVVLVTQSLAISPIIPVSSVASSTTASDAQIWNLKNADIRAVIQTISVLTGKNFIIDPRVHGKITLVSQNPMTPDELYQVFLSMLQLLQYVAIPSGSVIKIVPSMDGNALSRDVATNAKPGFGDEIVVRVVPVNHVSATELVPVLRPLMSQSGSVTAYLPSNALILAGTASNIARLVSVVHQMDSSNTNQISVVHLRYASAEKMVSVIRALQSGNAAQGSANNATLAPDEENNSILISANLANQLVMRNLINKLDQKGSGGDDTKVIPLNYLSAKKLAPILTKIAEGMAASQAQSPGGKKTDMSADESNVSIQAENTTNAIIMHAPKAMLNSLANVIYRLDSRPREVLVEAIIVNMDENLLNQLGIIWGTSNAASAASAVAAATTAGATAATISTAAAVASPDAFAMNANHSFGFLPDGNLLSLLQALKSDGSSDILSTPSVVVLDNQKATILDGQNIGVPNRSYQGASATTTGNPDQNVVTPFNTIQREDVALSLDVVPHVSPDRMIRLELLQEDNSLATSTTAAQTTQDNPVINTTKIKTSVLVHSGNILVLGGLISNEQEKTTQKLPILGDLPLIGRLFRYDTTTMDKKSLMVFIRPIIMSKHLEHKQTMNRYAYVRHQQIEMQTGKRLSTDAMPLLPALGESAVILPRPMPAMPVRLPAPSGQ
ncbi:MAG: type II secretion system protein GspD [Gammaproteobacteria bacterium RIFCSPHIGHO2_12_FULL_38_11]|nr:MAG: type II secretion system protein GspD [Gammaproteobacteria bacterium RIFCSPHIGHO2_12_FULL_38_11]